MPREDGQRKPNTPAGDELLTLTWQIKREDVGVEQREDEAIKSPRDRRA
jgi:hypothetical protein